MLRKSKTKMKTGNYMDENDFTLFRHDVFATLEKKLSPPEN